MGELSKVLSVGECRVHPDLGSIENLRFPSIRLSLARCFSPRPDPLSGCCTTRWPVLLGVAVMRTEQSVGISVWVDVWLNRRKADLCHNALPPAGL